jgi:23S rRNA (cytosine1962-C5)-methyltransferase
MITAKHLPLQITLKNKEDRRITSGHPWVFSNEIRDVKGKPAVGDCVEILASSGLTLGIGFYHPHSLIACRLISQTVEDIDEAFFVSYLKRALDLRQKLFPDETAYRLVHGEGDFLPGLIIDRYNDQFTIQVFSAGMESRLPLIQAALRTVCAPEVIILRNESPLRTLEELPLYTRVVSGTPSPLTISESGIRYTVNLLEGQKTGFFFDQRENRKAFARYASGARVLDCFCNDGGFSFAAVRGGAQETLGIDVSAESVKRATANAGLNGMNNARFREGDVFAVLNQFSSDEPYDLVALDPPSFTRSRKNVQTAKKGYRDLHLEAFKVLKPGGILLTASCSHHILPEVFLELVQESAMRADRTLQLLEWHGASPDHPTLPAVPETGYLKAGIFRVL